MLRFLPLILLLACTAGPDLPTVSMTREGADDYGMRSFVLAHLKTGPNQSATPKEAQALHMQNIERMAAEGKLVLAGPFLDGGALRGLCVFDTPSVDSARAWTASDPAVEAGVFDMELHPWYGSAALLAVNALHEQLATKPITD